MNVWLFKYLHSKRMFSYHLKQHQPIFSCLCRVHVYAYVIWQRILTEYGMSTLINFAYCSSSMETCTYAFVHHLFTRRLPGSSFYFHFPSPALCMYLIKRNNFSNIVLSKTTVHLTYIIGRGEGSRQAWMEQSVMGGWVQ